MVPSGDELNVGIHSYLWGKKGTETRMKFAFDTSRKTFQKVVYYRMTKKKATARRCGEAKKLSPEDAKKLGYPLLHLQIHL